MEQIGMRPRGPAGVVLQPVLLIGELILEHLTGIDIADRILPTRGTAVVAHVDVLLGDVRGDVVQDHIACRPAAGLEPG